MSPVHKQAYPPYLEHWAQQRISLYALEEYDKKSGDPLFKIPHTRYALSIWQRFTKFLNRETENISNKRIYVFILSQSVLIALHYLLLHLQRTDTTSVSPALLSPELVRHIFREEYFHKHFPHGTGITINLTATAPQMDITPFVVDGTRSSRRLIIANSPI